MDWKQYQNEIGEFFRGLGCDAEVEAKVVGVRAEHKIDVWVRFKKFGLETRAVELKYALHDLYPSEQTSPHSWTSRPRPGVDGSAVTRTIGKLAMLEYGFDRVRLKKPPYPVKFDDTGQRKVVVDTLDEFVVQASEVISDAESTLNSQNVQQSK